MSFFRHPFRGLLDRRRKKPELSRIRRKAQDLELARLIGSDADVRGDRLGITGADLLEATPRLLGFYSAEGVDYALGELGVYGQIEALGYTDVRSEVTGDARVQDLRIFGTADCLTHLVVEGRFKRTYWSAPAESPVSRECGTKTFDMALIEWFLLQNPKADFTPERPRLPGQKHPGLGLRDEIMEVFYVVARRLHLDGYLAAAKLFHNAVMYTPMFFFINPERQAELAAIIRAGEGRGLQDMTLAIEGGFLFQDGRPEPYQWEGDLMIRPLSERILSAFHRCGFRDGTEDLAERMTFRFDWAGFEDQRTTLVEKLYDEHPMSPEVATVC